ncbi:MAG: glycerol-3-phosphate acyltransferase, partial [Dehalococcoidia bacterium]|nr:glycerol-3-phosphate acyltransferase [Dehalococcoidia bacterium]
FPVFLRFKGGKGVSTTVGSYAVLAPLPCALSLVIFIGVIAWTRYVSLGSLLATASFPGLVLLLSGDGPVALLGVALHPLAAARGRRRDRLRSPWRCPPPPTPAARRSETSTAGGRRSSAARAARRAPCPSARCASVRARSAARARGCCRAARRRRAARDRCRAC